MKRLLITGTSGQLGGALAALAARKYQQHFEVITPSRNELDLSDLATVKSTIEAVRPDCLINPAAYTAVDAAESDAELAFKINAQAPKVMASVCAAHGVQMLHYSTDYVFNGQSTRPYLEDDSCDPQSVYGKSKLAGEQAVLAALPSSLIFRTAWVYAKSGKNFVNTMLRLAAEHNQVRVVNDQFGSPTLAEDLAEVSLRILADTPRDQLAERGGIYHATGSGNTSWAGFAREIFHLRGLSTEVDEIPSEAYPTPAPRPEYSVLDNAKLESVFGLALPSWQEALKRTLISS